MCPETVDNGVLGTCGRTVGSSCPVTCNKNYINTVDEVVCTESSKWSPKNACKREFLKLNKTSTYPNSQLPTTISISENGKARFFLLVDLREFFFQI